MRGAYYIGHPVKPFSDKLIFGLERDPEFASSPSGSATGTFGDLGEIAVYPSSLGHFCLLVPVPVSRCHGPELRC